MGYLSVGATPLCRVSIDGQYIANTPFYSRAVSAGTHHVTCERHDEAPQTRTIQIQAGREERTLF